MAIEIKDAEAQAQTPEACSMEMPKPQPEHEWLKQLVGEWTYEMQCDTGDGQMMKVNGTENVRSVGDYWVVGESTGETPGGTPATMMTTLGFDPLQGGYVGTWFGSMMTYLWSYQGTMDAAKRVLTLAADGPSMSGDGTLAQYKDVIEIISPNERTLTGNFLGPDGQWTEMMKMTFRRVA